MDKAVEDLGKASQFWLDPRDPFRQEAIEALRVSTGLSRRQIEHALDNCFGEITAAKLSSYIKGPGQALGSIGVRKTTQILHILPSNAFTAWVHGAVLTLLSGHTCVLKPSTHEPVLARAWKASLARVNHSLSDRVRIVHWDEEAFSVYHAVIAYGSDETLAKIKALLPPDVRFIGYGHKLSVGIVFKDADEDWREHLLHDAEPFDLKGCLSPQVVYMEKPSVPHGKALVERLVKAPAVQGFENWPELSEALRKYKPYLSCIGVAGSASEEARVRQTAADLGVSRVCSLGQMQRPPLDWRNDGVDLVDLLN